MELDDFKQAWKEAPPSKNLNTDIMELIKHKSYGPLSALKKAFLKEIRLMIVLPFLLIATNANDLQTVLTSVMFWSYVGFCIAMIAFSYTNYQTVNKMSRMDRIVRSNLEQQISVIETRLKWNLISARIIMLFFVVLTEVLPYFQHYRMLDKWHSLPVAVRFGTYALLIIAQYFVGKRVKQRKFGEHLAYLKQLTKEMQS